VDKTELLWAGTRIFSLGLVAMVRLCSLEQTLSSWMMTFESSVSRFHQIWVLTSMSPTSVQHASTDCINFDESGIRLTKSQLRRSCTPVWRPTLTIATSCWPKHQRPR